MYVTLLLYHTNTVSGAIKMDKHKREIRERITTYSPFDCSLTPTAIYVYCNKIMNR